VSVNRTLRTLWHIRPAQGLAQMRHALSRRREVASPAAVAPAWALRSWPVEPLAAPGHVSWNGEGRIGLIHAEADFESVDRIDWSHAEAGPLFAYQLHFFEWARAEGATPAARLAAIQHWIAKCESGVGWDSHPISVRTLAWLNLRFADGVSAEIGAAADAALRIALDRQIETLVGNLETRLQANHLLENRLAVVAGALALNGARSARWFEEVEPLLEDLSEQFGEEGAHYERSPMYHSVLLAHILDVLAIAKAVGKRAPRGLVKALAETAARALSALDVVTHPDGGIALLGDSVFGVAPPPQELRRYARELGVFPALARERDLLRSVGHGRLRGGELVAIASFGGPSPPHQPGHAHCDALSFELSVGKERVITDTGVFEYVPGERRTLSRSTGAHATLRVGGREQAEMWSGHRVGGRPSVELVSVVAGRAIEACCTSWSTARTVHRRRFEMVDGELRIEDRIEGNPAAVRATLPIATGLEAMLAAGHLSIALASGGALCVDLPEGFDWRLVRAPYYPEFGREEERSLLIGDAAEFRRGNWTFRLER
jgi:hypothetical protein